MHETIIANRIIEEAKKSGASKSFTLEVGELAELTAEEIKDALTNITNLSIDIIKIKSLVECECGYTGKANILERGHGYCYYNCPKCSKNPKIIMGGEIKITKIE